MGSLRRVVSAAVVAVTWIAIASAGAAPAASPPAPAPVGAVAPIDRVLALVDGTPIWWSSLSEALAAEPAPATDAARKQLEATALDRLIDEALINERARAMKVEVPDSEVDAALKEIMTQNNLDQAGLTAALAQMGFTMTMYRESLRQQITNLRTIQLATMPPPGTTPEKRDAMRDAWLADLRRAARIERR